MAEVANLVELLRAEADWITKREIAHQMGVAFTAAFDRKMRAISEVGAPVIVGWPGSPGLKHIDFATVAEMQHAVRAHLAQAGRQRKRANVYAFAMRSKFGLTAEIGVAESVQSEMAFT